MLAARLACLEDAPDVEKLLRRGLAAAAGDGDARRDASELLCRFLLERGDAPGAAALLVDLGYAATFSPRALAGRLPTQPAAREAGAPLHIQVLGLATIAADVTPELARAAIASVEVLGAFQASPAVKAALADRTV